jgi:hypothetical protein
LTQNAVVKITHSGAPDAISGMDANCALPANTSNVMATASTALMPELIMATPVISPQAPMPVATLARSRTPMRYSGWR